MWRRLSVSILLCAACGTGTSPESASAESFLTGLPSRLALEISSPAAHAPASLTTRSEALVGRTADLYVLTRKASAEVNGVVGNALDTLQHITRNPPAAVGPETAVWGPITDALSPVVARLVVQRVNPGAHTFRVDLRARSADDSTFAPFLQGASTGAAPGGPTQGSFSLDLTLAHRLDPVAQPTGGQLVAGWTVAPAERQVHIHLTDVGTESGLANTGDVGALTGADGSGELALDARGDLDGDPASIETGTVRSRWVPDGAGRADVQTRPETGDGMWVTECWDSSFARVFASGATPDGGVASEGDPAACVFADPLR